MDLEKVREKLINLEDIIIQGLCQRAKFKHNNTLYEHNSEKFVYNNNYEELNNGLDDFIEKVLPNHKDEVTGDWTDDRIREYVAVKVGDSSDIINRALNSTLSRTINTSLTTFFVLNDDNNVFLFLPLGSLFS